MSLFLYEYLAFIELWPCIFKISDSAWVYTIVLNCSDSDVTMNRNTDPPVNDSHVYSNLSESPEGAYLSQSQASSRSDSSQTKSRIRSRLSSVSNLSTASLVSSVSVNSSFYPSSGYPITKTPTTGYLASSLYPSTNAFTRTGFPSSSYPALNPLSKTGFPSSPYPIDTNIFSSVPYPSGDYPYGNVSDCVGFPEANGFTGFPNYPCCDVPGATNNVLTQFPSLGFPESCAFPGELSQDVEALPFIGISYSQSLGADLSQASMPYNHSLAVTDVIQDESLQNESWETLGMGYLGGQYPNTNVSSAAKPTLDNAQLFSYGQY